jgi:hypothetical protein
MTKETFISNLLLKVNADHRITNGIFNVLDKTHILILKEYLLEDIKDSNLVSDIITPLIDESEASELAHKKGWEFKGGYWWKGNEPIARTVKGKLMTLSQIEDEQKREKREREIEKIRNVSKDEKDKEERIAQQEREKQVALAQKGEFPVQDPQVQQIPQEAPIAVQEPVVTVEPEQNLNAKVADIKSKMFTQLTKEGKSISFSAVLNNDKIVGFIMENGKFVIAKSSNDPRYTLSKDSLKANNWVEFL